jgi:hypothetical protein
VTGPEFSLEAARWSILIFQEILARLLNCPPATATATTAASPKMWTFRGLHDELTKPRQLEVTAADISRTGGGQFLLLSAAPDLDVVLADPTGRANYSTAAGHQACINNTALPKTIAALLYRTG